MPLLDKPIDALTEANLRALVEGAVSESRTLDYKEALPGRKDSDKTKFLANVAAFANAEGGVLLFGVQETGGVAVAVPGVGVADVDATVLQLDSSIRTGIEPRLRNVEWATVPLENGQTVVALEVPPSYARPHMVTFGGHNRFYVRHSRGRAPMSVDEIRAAFGVTGAAFDRVQRFRLERLDVLRRGEGPFEMVEGSPLYVLHVLPLALADPVRSRPPTNVTETDHRLRPLPGPNLGEGATGFDAGYNFDGVAAYVCANRRGFRGFRPRPDGPILSYTQVLGGVAIEAVRTEGVHVAKRRLLQVLRRERSLPVVRPCLMEDEVVFALERHLSLLTEREVLPPFLIGVSLLGVRGHVIGAPREPSFVPLPLNSDRLVVSEVVLDRYDAEMAEGDARGFLAAAMRPAFDAVWNAAGHSRSPRTGGEPAFYSVITGGSGVGGRVGAAIHARDEGRYDAALATLVVALEDDPTNADALVLRADVLCRQAEVTAAPESRLGLLRDALAAVDAARAVAPEGEWVRNGALNVWATAVNLGNGVIRDPDEDPKVAAELFALGVDANPDALQGHFGLGLAHLRSGDAAAAVDPLRRAVEIDPGDPGPAAYYGRALLFSDQATEAVHYLEAASARFPDDDEIETTLLNAYDRSGQTDRAVERYESAVQTKPTDPVVRYNYGALLLQAQRYDEAIEQLEEATELDAANADAFYNLGAAYQNKAASLNDQANQAEDGAESARLAMDHDENLEAALPSLQRAREIWTGTSREADACAALFRVYTQLGRVDDAEAVSGCAGIEVN